MELGSFYNVLAIYFNNDIPIKVLLIPNSNTLMKYLFSIPVNFIKEQKSKQSLFIFLYQDFKQLVKKISFTTESWLGIFTITTKNKYQALLLINPVKNYWVSPAGLQSITTGTCTRKTLTRHERNNLIIPWSTNLLKYNCTTYRESSTKCMWLGVFKVSQEISGTVTSWTFSTGGYSTNKSNCVLVTS